MAVELKIDGELVTGWRKVGLHHSLDEVAQTFSLELFGTFSDVIEGTDLPKRYLGGTPCEVIVDGSVFITGYIEGTERSIKAQSYSYKIGGRSRTGALVKSDAVIPGQSWKKRSLRQMAEDLCGPLGIAVVSDLKEVDAVFIRHSVHDGQKSAEVLSRAAKVVGVRLFTTPEGDLSFVLAPDATDLPARYKTVLKRGVTIEGSSFTEDTSERYSRYLVKGQTSGRDGWRGDKMRTPHAEVLDAGIELDATLFVHPETQADTEQCQKRGEWERQQRAGSSVRIGYDMFGWSPALDPDTDLWRPNRIVRVDDDIEAIHTDLLVTVVDLSLEDGVGEQTRLSLRLPQSYGLATPPSKSRTGDLRW